MSTQISPTTNLPAVDGIRGLACLLVLLVHATSMFWRELAPQLSGGGKYGVWLFFVLSAFLLTLRLQQRGFGAASLTDYASGRALRILPPFALACMLYYFLGQGIKERQELVAALTLQQGFIHLWTIPVEFKFYLLLPPLAFASIWLQRRHGDAVLLGISLLSLAITQVIWPYWLTPENSPATRWYLGTFLLGIVAALLLPRARRLPRAAVATPFAIATLLLLVAALPGTRLWLLGAAHTSLMDKHLYFGLLWALFLLLLADGHGLAGRLLCSRPLRWLGNVSYSTYLFHWALFQLLSERLPSSPAGVLAAMALALLAGALGYHLLEQPAEQLRRRLWGRGRHPASPPLQDC